MEKLPKLRNFTPPEGYFENLPDELIGKTNTHYTFHWVKWAAIASLIISLGVWKFDFSGSNSGNNLLDQEVELYIDSNYWSDEDILSMADNPEQILNDILDEELAYADELWDEGH